MQGAAGSWTRVLAPGEHSRVIGWEFIAPRASLKSDLGDITLDIGENLDDVVTLRVIKSCLDNNTFCCWQ